MAKSPILRPRTAQDIDGRIDRVLRGLGNPEPPLSLDQVRELLKLDRAFYTADDPTIVREVISRIRVATIQVAQRPMLLVDAIKKWSLQALYVPDRKRILLDASLPQKKHRWNEAHEIGHSLIPWHDDVMHGDKASRAAAGLSTPRHFCGLLKTSTTNDGLGIGSAPHKRPQMSEPMSAVWRSVEESRRLGRSFELAKKPCLRKLPVACHRVRRDPQDFRCLLDGQPSKEPQLDNLTLPRILLAQRPHGIVQCHDVGAFVGCRKRHAVE